jgi:hypothetical protein
MARKILIQAEPFKDSFKLTIPSEYNRAVVKELVLKDKVTLFELNPRIRSSKNQRGYLEGAVIPVYCHWQYGLDPRKPDDIKRARDLFKLDFHYEIVKTKTGEPKKIPVSLRNEQAHVLNKYTEWASENGAPIPNENLYKLWRDHYSMYVRWEHYWDWLDYLGLEHDSMPSAEAIKEKMK